MAAAESETEAQHLISRLGKQLNTSKTCPNKDTLVKLLKKALSALPRLKQMESLNPVIRPLSDSLIKHGLLQHKDKDIKLLVATCFCEIIRVLAPDPRFSDGVFRDIFKLLLSIFTETDDMTSPYFSKRLKLLETVAKLNFCVLMLDIGREDLVLKMFKIFFSVVREQHPHSMISAMSSIMTRLLEEKLEEKDLEPLVFQEKFSEPLLDVIYQNLLKESKGASAGSAQLAVSVIQSCTEKLERLICTFLRSCILNRDIIESEIKESYHEIIYEIFRIAPQMLLSVIPSLSQELLTDQVDVRIKALNLIKKFFALPGHNIAQEYRNLFMEFMNRFSDKSAEVRLCALSCVEVLYSSNPSGIESVEVLTALESRLLDFDDRVRTQAVILVCDLARSKVNSSSNELICLVAERLRDKKVSVRKKALQKLLELYHDYCTKCVEDMMMLSNHFEQIPCKILMLCYDKDCKEFRPQSLELVLAEDLFPDSLSIEARTRHWIFLFSLFTPLHMKALKIILSQKRRLRDALQAYIDLWSRKKEIGSDEMERRTKALVAKMSASFPDPGEAEMWFHKLKEVKDNDTFRVLRELLNGGDAHSIRDHVLRKVGDWSPPFEFRTLLSAKCSLNIFSSGHIYCIFDYLTNADFVWNKHFKDSSMQLLLTIIRAFPLLLRSYEEKFLQLLAKDVTPFNEQILEILAKEGSNIYIELSDIYYLLERVCLEGTRAHAKLAVTAIKALSGSSEQVVFSKLCKMLLDSVHLGQNIPTALQSLGCIAQHSPSVFEAQEEEISCYIHEEVFAAAPKVGKSSELNLFDETSECCKSCKLKIYGLKTLVRSFLPNSRTPVNRNLNYLLDIISKMLQMGSFSVSTEPCHSDRGNIQLAAAKSVLFLSRKWDLHISPLIFRLTMLVARDNSPFVRRLFVNKVHKLLKEHAVPGRYACTFSFASLDSEDDPCDNSLKYMGEYIKASVKRAGVDRSDAIFGLINHPAYMIVFLIHVLAHDTNFPAMECQDEEMYIKPASPLLFSVQALLNTNFYDGDLEVVNTALYLRSIFNAIKRAEDAIDARMTAKLHLLADVGISLLHTSDSIKVTTTGNPELILLPSSLYKVGPAERWEAYSSSSSLNKYGETLIRKLTHTLGSRTSQTSYTVKKHVGQCCEEDSLITNANKTSKSNLTVCKRSNASRTQINEQSYESYPYQKELHETSNPDIDAGTKCLAVSSQPPRTFEVHNEFSIGDELNTYAIENFEAISNDQLPSACDSVATKQTLGQKEILSSCSRQRDMITRCNSKPARTSKLATANHFKLRISENKDTGEKLVIENIQLISAKDKSHTEHSSVSSEMEMFDVVGCDYDRNSMKENTKFCSNQIPLHENIKKVQKSKNAPTKAINVKEDNVARRTRRRKV